MVLGRSDVEWFGFRMVARKPNVKVWFSNGFVLFLNGFVRFSNGLVGFRMVQNKMARKPNFKRFGVRIEVFGIRALTVQGVLRLILY